MISPARATAVESFAPLSRPDAKLLVLGSMPGRASLGAGQYYAHPRNAFWPVMGALFGFDPGLDYRERVARLTRAGVAVWDVLACCERRGSLDADILPSSAVPNNFAAFYAAHPGIRRVLFNGATAERSYRRQVLPGLEGWAAELPLRRLPSTSPAHASLDIAAKLAAWRVAAG